MGPPLPRWLLPAWAAQQGAAEPWTPAQGKRPKGEPRAQGDSTTVTCPCSTQHSGVQTQRAISTDTEDDTQGGARCWQEPCLPQAVCREESPTHALGQAGGSTAGLLSRWMNRD